MEMHGLWGFAGWQWLFVVEAVPAVLLGFAVVFYAIGIWRFRYE